MIGGKWYDMVVGVDLHWVMVPAPPSPSPIPAPLPHPFTGLVFDPIGLAVSTAMAAGMSAISGNAFGGPVLINSMPAAATGTEATNKLVMPHFPMPPGLMWAPVPAGPKPPIPGKKPDPGIPTPIPSNDAIMITGSKLVYCNGTNACRLGDLAMSCGEPVRLPSSTMIAIPMGMPVLIGGPPALDFIAALTSTIRSQWVSSKLHQVTKAPPGSWRSKAICFFTGHPVDVVSGMVMTEAVDFELPGPIPFKLERTYYSRATYQGPLGQGWNHSYDQFLRKEDSRWVYHGGDGRDLYFYLGEKETKTRNDSERLDFKLGEEEIFITTADRITLVFGNRNREDGSLPLLRIENRFGDKIVLHYNASGTLTSIVDSSNREIGFQHDQDGHLTHVTAPHPENTGARIDVMRFEFSEEGDLEAAIDALDQPFRYAYKHHLLVQETNRNGYSFYFAYDGIDHDANCVRTWGDEGMFDHVLTYDPVNKVTIVENSYGDATAYYGNDGGLVEKIIDPLGNEIQYTWDENFRKTSETDPEGNQTQWQYDDLGNCIKLALPDSTSILAKFDEHGNHVQSIGRDGQKRRFRYDSLGRLVTLTDPLGHETCLFYEGKHIVGQKGPGHSQWQFERDPAGNILKAEEKDGSSRTWEYDLWGRARRMIWPGGAVTDRILDVKGQLLLVDSPEGNSIRQQFDPEGNLTYFRDSHIEAEFEYGALNRLTARTQAQTKVGFEYDREGHLTGIINQLEHVYRFDYDAAGRLVKEIGFDGGEQHYLLNKIGLVIQQRRQDNSTIDYDYDAMGQITAVKYADGRQETFSYRKDGFLEAATNEDTALAWERDPLGRPLRTSHGNAWIHSQYNAAGFRTALSSSHGANARFERDSRGQAQRITIEGEQRAWQTSVKRDALGHELEREVPGQTIINWERDDIGRVQHHRWTTGQGGQRERRYTWNSGNRIERIEDNASENRRFRYDAAGHLTETLWESGQADLRIPDAVGNLFRDRALESHEYGPDGRLLRAGKTRYNYDQLGRRIEKRDIQGRVWRYCWDGADRLVKVVRPDGSDVQFFYDPLGRRIRKQYRGKVTHWLWDGDVILHEWTVQTQPEVVTQLAPVSLSHGDDLEARVRSTPANGPPHLTTWYFEPESHAPMARVKDGQYVSYINDHLGVPLAAVDASGHEIARGDWDTFGFPRGNSALAEVCPFRFPGQYADEETGLFYNRFRYYDPETGTYISPDPEGLNGGLALYAYVHNPATWSDPLGLTGDCDVSPNNPRPPVTYYRVQGGTPPNASRHRIRFDSSGDVKIKKGTLNVSTGDLDHARYFRDKRVGSQIYAFDIPKWLDDLIQDSAIPQKGYKTNPNNQGGTAPKLVDPNQPGTSYELPPIWSEWLEENAIPGSGRIVT